jgi:hypothetical protein
VIVAGRHDSRVRSVERYRLMRRRNCHKNRP